MPWLIEFDLPEVDERSITCPFLESYVLPELSTILVLGAVDMLLPLADALVFLPETALLVETARPAAVPLPERFATEEPDLIAELLL